MFCSKCGSPLQEGAKFCSKCGNPAATNVAPKVAVTQETQAPQYQYAPQAAPAKKPANKKLIGIIAAVAAVIVIAVVLIICLGGSSGGASSYKDCALGYARAMYKEFNMEKVMAYIPDAIINASLEDDDTTLQEHKEEGQEYLDYLKLNLENYYGDYSIRISIADSYHYDKSDLEDFNADLKDEYNGKLGKVTDAYDIELSIVLSYENDDGDKDTYEEGDEITVGKIGNKWYIVDMP